MRQTCIGREPIISVKPVLKEDQLLQSNLYWSRTNYYSQTCTLLVEDQSLVKPVQVEHQLLVKPVQIEHQLLDKPVLVEDKLLVKPILVEDQLLVKPVLVEDQLLQ